MINDYFEIKINDKTDEAIGELFELFLKRYQIGLETTMKGSYFYFDCVSLLHNVSLLHKCHKINFKRGGSHIDSPDWIKN